MMSENVPSPENRLTGNQSVQRGQNRSYRNFEDFGRDLLRVNCLDPDAYSVEIGPGDEMFYKAVLPGYGGDLDLAKFKYIESAVRTFHVYRQLAAFGGGLAHLRSVLDFGSGWGRLTRLLVHSLLKEKIWVADVYHDAIAWQVDRFGVNGVISSTRPDRFALPCRYAIVFAASVFSHLPADLFQRWLARLYRLVAPGGLLAFSVHSDAMLPHGATVDATGFYFEAWSESGSLDTASYGMAYVTEAFVSRAIAGCAPDRKVSYKRFRKALYENQDLFVVGGEGVDVGTLTIDVMPICGVNGTAMEGGGSLVVDGWGMDLNAGCHLELAQLHADGVLLAETRPTVGSAHVAPYFPGAPNPPSAWSFNIPALAVSADHILRATLTSSSGISAHAYLSRLDETGAFRHT